MENFNIQRLTAITLAFLPFLGMAYPVAGSMKGPETKSRIELAFNMALPIDITGTITDEDNVPLIGVNIQVKGTNKGTSSDLDGRFLLEDIDKNAVLVVSYIGYETQEIAVAGKTNISISLRSDSQLLDEVVVIGYGTLKKSDLTGSITQVKAEELQKHSPANVSDLLRTTVPGLNVGYSTSAKGNSAFEIR